MCSTFHPDSSVAGLIYVDNRGRERRFEREDAEFLLWAGQFLQLYSETIRLRQRLEVQVGELKRCAERDVSIVAESKEILDILALAKRIAPSNANVLILGETGSGKRECRGVYSPAIVAREGSFCRQELRSNTK